MGLRIAVLHETVAGETRVAATPETVKKLSGLGAALAVERGAGIAAGIADRDYEQAGAMLADRAAVLAGADIVLAVQAPEPASLSGLAPGAWVVAAFDPFRQTETVAAYAAAGLEALAMDWMPRITRAQSMDILSSQSNLAGYKAVLEAASAYGRAFPMMMTAAGTIPAARVFVMGVGVAGLQAIATARRLGAQVSATDVRSATREQIQSLGAKPIFVEGVAGIEGEGAGGYAGETSEDYRRAQAELVAGHIAKQDIVITTALIPGRRAPTLLHEATVAEMKPGSVVIDLAASQGGNCPLTELDRVVVRHGVTLVGYGNLAARVPADASALYARNLLDFLKLVLRDGAFHLDLADDIVAACLMCHGGELRRKNA